MHSIHEERLPPGTVLLLSQDQDATDEDHVVLQPTPSNDPNDPLNWSMLRKSTNYLFVLAVTVAAFTAIQIQTIFWQQMVVDMDVTITQLSNAVSVQLVGLAMGCLIFIPLTKKYGRRLTYILATLAMTAMSFWSAEMKSTSELYITNLLYGLACSTNETVVQMTIADVFFVHQRGTANAFYVVAVMVGSFLTTMAAGSQAASQGWRWSYRTVGICLAILSILFVFCFEETKFVPITNARFVEELSPSTKSNSEHMKDKAVIDNGASHQAKTTDDSLFATNSGRADLADPPRPNSYRERMRLITPTNEPLLKLIAFPLRTIMFPHVVYTALQYANGVSFLVLIANCNSILFSAPPYNFTTAGVGYMALGPFVGNLIGSIYGGVLNDWLVVRLAQRKGGYFEPEMRLYLLGLPAVCMPAGIIMYGATIDRGLHWIFPSIGGALFAFGLGSIGDASFTLIIDTYYALTAECFVLVTFIRNAVTIAIPFSTIPWIEHMGLTNMFVTAGCINLAFSLLFVPLIVYGKQIRTKLQPQYEKMVISQSKVLGN